LALDHGTGLAARERKDRQKKRDKKLLKWAEIRCERWADNRDYLEFDPLIFPVFCVFCALFAAIPSLRSLGSFAAIPAKIWARLLSQTFAPLRLCVRLFVSLAVPVALCDPPGLALN
jgi:hypothetical protein